MPDREVCNTRPTGSFKTLSCPRPLRFGPRNAATWLACLLLTVAQALPSLANRPNVVLIVADDLGWSDLSCYGHPWHRTPEIDGIARAGVRFTHAYAPAPICSASRASILTGKVERLPRNDSERRPKPPKENLVRRVRGNTGLSRGTDFGFD
ncbi:MAG: sulfatase-like hydrolase/transferase [Planctomycetota bacterium]